MTIIPQVFKPEDSATHEQEIIPQSTIGRNSKESTVHPNDSQAPFASNDASSHEFNPQNFPQPPVNDQDDDKMEVSHRMEIMEATNSPSIVLSTIEETHVPVENATKSVIQVRILKKLLGF